MIHYASNKPTMVTLNSHINRISSSRREVLTGSPSGYVDFNRMLPKQASEYPHRHSNKTFLIMPEKSPHRKKERKPSFSIKQLEYESVLK